MIIENPYKGDLNLAAWGAGYKQVATAHEEQL
jgi:hypothetical protein